MNYHIFNKMTYALYHVASLVKVYSEPKRIAIERSLITSGRFEDEFLVITRN